MGIFSRLFTRGQEPGSDQPTDASEAPPDLADAIGQVVASSPPPADGEAPGAYGAYAAGANGSNGFSHPRESATAIVQPPPPVAPPPPREAMPPPRQVRPPAQEVPAMSAPISPPQGPPPATTTATAAPAATPTATPTATDDRMSERAKVLLGTPRLAGGVPLTPRAATPPAGVPTTARVATPPVGVPVTTASGAPRPPASRMSSGRQPAAPPASPQPPVAPHAAAPVAPPPATRPSGPIPHAPIPAPRPAAAQPAIAPPPPIATHNEALLDQVVEALDALSSESDAVPIATTDEPREGRSTPEDIAAARKVFEDLAIGHVAQVRDVMLELQLGDVPCSWVASSKPVLGSLRAMAGQMELTDLCGAIDEFCAAVDAAIANRTEVVGTGKDELLGRYQRLIELIPQAFELTGERDRREPIIVESLLRQVPGVEAHTIDKLRAVGLGRLDTLLQANAEDMAATSGIRLEIAAAIVEHLRAYRDGGRATVAAPDVAAAQRELRGLIATLRKQHDDFERAAAGWSDDLRADKRTRRKDREQTFLRLKVTLARMGENDRITRLEKLPFQERIVELERYLATLPRAGHGG